MAKDKSEKSSVKPSGVGDWLVFIVLIFVALWLATWMRTGENPFKDVHIQPGQPETVQMIVLG